VKKKEILELLKIQLSYHKSAINPIQPTFSDGFLFRVSVAFSQVPGAPPTCLVHGQGFIQLVVVQQNGLTHRFSREAGSRLEKSVEKWPWSLVCFIYIYIVKKKKHVFFILFLIIAAIAISIVYIYIHAYIYTYINGIGHTPNIEVLRGLEGYISGIIISRFRAYILYYRMEGWASPNLAMAHMPLWDPHSC
jgi:hypothetical protein